MRTKHSLLQPLAAAALCAIAASTAVAQGADYARAGIHAESPAVDLPPRPVIIYQLQSPRNPGMPTQVTVADSAGEYVASFTLRGGSTAHPMLLDLRDKDIVLQGETPAGVLTLTMRRPDDADAPRAVIGYWSLGTQQGELLRVAH